MAQFTRFAETVKCKEQKRVYSITVKLLIDDCTGTIWFTDIQAQEGDRLTGYTINTETMLEKYRENGEIVPPRHYNGVIRTAETAVIFNLGQTSAGLDCYVYPIQAMKSGSISLSQGSGSHKVTFDTAANAGDELALLASSRECLKNNAPIPKSGFFQYSAAQDSKHPITVENRKSARVLFEYQEMQDGGDSY